jgi:L-lactate permease
MHTERDDEVSDTAARPGHVALAAIMLAAILSSCMNAYSSSLAFQAAGLALKRPWLTIGICGATLGLVTLMQTGSVLGAAAAAVATATGSGRRPGR